MKEKMGDPPRKRDWRVSATLLGIWLVALFVIRNRELDIPLSMLAIATAFFVILIPAMNDLVSSLDRYFSGPDATNDTDGTGHR